MKITAGSAPGPTRSTKSFLGSERFRKLCLPAASASGNDFLTKNRMLWRYSVRNCPPCGQKKNRS